MKFGRGVNAVPGVDPDPGANTYDDEWKRVHPASPFVRGWVGLAAVLYFVGRDVLERLVQGRPAWDEADIDSGRLARIAVIGGVLLLLFLLGFVLSWLTTRYQVGADHVRINSGILFRQSRQARLDRVQAIDIVQPFLARIFGLAELRFEVADAGQSAVKLSFLKLEDAKELRATILARAAGLKAAGSKSVASGPAQGDLTQATVPHESSEPESSTPVSSTPQSLAPQLAERHVLSVPHGRLLGSIVISEATVGVLLGAAASVVLSVLTESGAFYLYLIPAALGIGASYWSAFNKGFNFVASWSMDGIRLRYGLLDTRTQTVPPGRIQALKVSQSPLWRLFGWYRIQVNVAGYGASSEGENGQRTLLLPVGTQGQVVAMVALVVPGMDAHQAGVFGAGLMGLTPKTRQNSEPAAFRTSPRQARFLSPLAYRRNGFAVIDSALLIRSGRLWRTLVLVPHERTQSMALVQGPLARRFGLVDLILHTSPGPVTPRLLQASLREGQELFEQQARRAREARGRQHNEHWLTPQTQQENHHG
ncbi:PH domain-containing protein [Pseudarthrobacter sp. J1763]|uniref:PH domain-containing protein n=1 Tax=Pseudarthrobacter sp. J1763 TaxID=3420445 RepID=UPI003D2888F2